jgi:hypothetical protein
MMPAIEQQRSIQTLQKYLKVSSACSHQYLPWTLGTFAGLFILLITGMMDKFAEKSQVKK